MVRQAFDEAEDRALDEQRRHHFRPGELAMLRAGRLLLIDQAPDFLEDLLTDDSSDQAEDDADRREDDLHRPSPSGEAASEPNRASRSSGFDAIAIPAPMPTPSASPARRLRPRLTGLR